MSSCLVAACFLLKGSPRNVSWSVSDMVSGRSGLLKGRGSGWMLWGVGERFRWVLDALPGSRVFIYVTRGQGTRGGLALYGVAGETFELEQPYWPAGILPFLSPKPPCDLAGGKAKIAVPRIHGVQGSAPREEPKAEARHPAGRDAWARAFTIYLTYFSFTEFFAAGALYYNFVPYIPMLLLEAIYASLFSALFAFLIYRKPPPRPLLSPAQRASWMKTAIVLGHVAGCLLVAAMYIQGLASWIVLLAALFLLLGALLSLYRVYFSLTEDRARGGQPAQPPSQPAAPAGFAFCPYCGGRLRGGEVYCPYCGRKLPEAR